MFWDVCMMNERGPDVSQVVLERMKFAAHIYLNEQLAKDFAIPAQAQLEEHVKFACDLAVFTIKQTILGRELERIEARYPADWWQAFKARWFPAWVLKRWPVKEIVRELVARELYPKMAMPDQGAVLNLSGE